MKPPSSLLAYLGGKVCLEVDPQVEGEDPFLLVTVEDLRTTLVDLGFQGEMDRFVDYARSVRVVETIQELVDRLGSIYTPPQTRMMPWSIKFCMMPFGNGKKWPHVHLLNPDIRVSEARPKLPLAPMWVSEFDAARKVCLYPLEGCSPEEMVVLYREAADYIPTIVAPGLLDQGTGHGYFHDGREVIAT